MIPKKLVCTLVIRLAGTHIHTHKIDNTLKRFSFCSRSLTINGIAPFAVFTSLKELVVSHRLSSWVHIWYQIYKKKPDASRNSHFYVTPEFWTQLSYQHNTSTKRVIRCGWLTPAHRSCTKKEGWYHRSSIPRFTWQLVIGYYRIGGRVPDAW